MIPYFFYGSGMYRKHPNHTYGRNRNDSANNRAFVEHMLLSCYVAPTKVRIFGVLGQKYTAKL